MEAPEHLQTHRHVRKRRTIGTTRSRCMLPKLKGAEWKQLLSIQMLRKKWAKNVELKGTEWKQLASFRKSLLCRDNTETAVTEKEAEAVLLNRPLLVTIRYGPLLSWYLKSTRYRKRSILKKEAVPLYSETNDLGSRKSMDVEMREPWAMKQAHKNVAYKWNRTERSLISKINKVEMREPLAMKQAHKNVVYKRNRAERSLISKINKGRDSRAMSNEAST